MRIYVAARYQRQADARKLANRLKKEGYHITSRWVYGLEPDEPWDAAIVDLSDVQDADCLVALTEEKGINPNNGGRHVELGYALALGKRIILFGPRENVFHYHPDVEQCGTLEELSDRLAEQIGVTC